MEAIVLENEVLRLPRIEQVLLADRLMQALSEPDPRVMEAWASEGERRLEEYHAGRLLAEDGESVIQSDAFLLPCFMSPNWMRSS